MLRVEIRRIFVRQGYKSVWPTPSLLNGTTNVSPKLQRYGPSFSTTDKQRNVAAQTRKPSRETPKSVPSAPLPKAGHSRANSKESSKQVEIALPPAPRKTSGEYGRLFIKVAKLKDLELPLPKGISPEHPILITDEPMYFSCTLDNGLHCVTTPFKLLNQKESKIDQEFELCVPAPTHSDSLGSQQIN